MKKIAWLLELLLVSFVPAQAQNLILQTADALTLGKGKLEAGVGCEYLAKTHSPAPDIPRSLLRIFVASAHYGVAENVNFDLDWRGVLLANFENGQHGSDWGDLIVSTRITLVHEENGASSVGLRTAVKLPSTSYLPYRLGSDQTDFHAQLLLTNNFSGVRTRLNVGLSILGNPQAPGSQDDVYSLQGAILLPLGETEQLFMEMIGFTGYRDDDAKLVSRLGVMANVGLIEWNLYGSLRLAGNNRDFGNAFEQSENWGVGLMFTKVFDLHL